LGKILVEIRPDDLEPPLGGRCAKAQSWTISGVEKCQ